MYMHIALFYLHVVHEIFFNIHNKIIHIENIRGKNLYSTYNAYG